MASSEAGSEDPYEYRRIAATVREKIRSGEIPIGGRAPSVRKLATQFDVSRGTAQKAVEVLRREGVLTTAHGIGTIVAKTPDAPSVSPEEVIAEHEQRIGELELEIRQAARSTEVSDLREQVADLRAELLNIAGKVAAPRTKETKSADVGNTRRHA